MHRLNKIFLILLLFPVLCFAQVDLKNAIELYNSGKYEQAAEIFRGIFDSNSQPLGVYQYLADCYNHLKQHDKAIEILEKADKIYPQNEEVIFSLGKLYASQNNYNEAEKLLKKVIELNPKNDEAKKVLGAVFYNKGVLLYQQKNLLEAASFFRRSVELDPLNENAQLNLAGVLFEQKQFEKAKEQVEKARKIFPNNLNLKKAYAQLLLGLKEYNAASILLQDIVKSEPNNFEASLLLANAYQYQNEKEKVVSLYENLIRDFPNEKKTYFIYANYLKAIDRVEKVKDVFEKLILFNKNNLKVMMEIADAYILDDKYTEAQSLYQRIIELNPNSIEARISSAKCFLETKEKTLAKKNLDEVLEIDRQNYSAYKILFKLYMEDSLFVDALNLNRLFLNYYPNDYYPKYQIGIIYKSLNNIDSAFRYFKWAYEQESLNPFVLYQVASCYNIKCEMQSALEYYKLSLKYNIIKLDEEQKNLSASLSENKSLENIDMRRDYASKKEDLKILEENILSSLIFIKQNLEQKEYGILLDNYITEYPTSLFLLINRAELNCALGNLLTAKADYEKAIKINPKVKKAHFGLAKIFEQQNDFYNSLLSYKRIIYADEVDNEAYSGLITNAIKLNKLNDVCDELIILYKSQPENKILKERLIEVLHKSGRLEEAKEIINQK